MIVFDRDGNFLRSWGDGVFKRAHGATIGPDETIFLTDDGDHTVRKCSLDGKVLHDHRRARKSLRPIKAASPSIAALMWRFRRGAIFTFPTATVIRACTSIRRMASCFSPGASRAADPGQFNIVHNIVTDKEGWVYVADRENNRVQVFDGNGKYETQWNNMHRPCALYMDTTKTDPLCYVGELGPGLGVNINAPNLGNRVDIYDKQGKRLARLGDIFAGEKPGQFIAPHGIAIDSRGDIYIGEVSWTIMGQRLQPPRELRSLQKLKKVN